MTDPAEVKDALTIKDVLEEQAEIGYVTRCTKCGHHSVCNESENTRKKLVAALEIARNKLSVIVSLSTTNGHVQGTGCVAFDGLEGMARILSEL